ncbi:MAG TPA: S9 family peptidase [Pyrinomonadaceae bacterium]|jgi:oligopeptidase B|nr:S9 family peptidase [Pyrinomonadaceae bacterium]
MRRSLSILVLIAALSLPFSNPLAQTKRQTLLPPSPPPAPPSARQIPKRISVHGDAWDDNYFWLREKTNPEVIAYLKAENAYTDAFMKPTEPLQRALYNEMLARIKETDVDAAYRQGGYFYYTRSAKGQQYKIYARRRVASGAAEQITLDLNEMAKGHTFIRVDTYDVSLDGNLLAYSVDTTGYREYTLYVKDLRTGRTNRLAERVSSAAWANDNRTIFYVVDDPVSKRPFRLYRHTLGKATDELLFEEKDEMFELSVSRTRSRRFVLLTSASHTTSEVRYLAADTPAESFRVIEAREAGHEYYVEHAGDAFYIRTNEGGAKNFKLAVAPFNAPQRRNWKEILPHRKDVILEDVDLFANHYVVSERDNGQPRLRITELASNRTHYLEFPEPVYNASLDINKEFDTRVLRFNYESFITPVSIYDYDMVSRKRELVKQKPVLGHYDPTEYKSERIYATASDGTRIPISLVYKKGLKLDGSRPLLLTGYGSYGYPWPIEFESTLLSLLDRGVVYAHTHIRGGGELGKQWHDQGKMMNKRNTFTDFIASAEHLLREKYTSRDRLAITGLSAGGLLIGAVTNMRPELFKAVVMKVPFVDVINTMLDATLPLTAGEWEEWGNPIASREQYLYMKSYSPYDNIEAKEYPAMLVTTSLNDSQVLYHEPAKYVAKLRAMKTDRNPLLLKTNMGAGHGGAAGRYDFLKETAFDYAFILTELGITR